MSTTAESRIAAIERIEDDNQRLRQTLPIMAQDANGRIICPQVPGIERYEVFAYPDGSYILYDIMDQEKLPAVKGDFPALDAIMRACSELPRACPCPMAVCPEPHHQCCRCGTKNDLVSGPYLPVALRRAWCRTCWDRNFEVPYEYPAPAAA